MSFDHSILAATQHSSWRVALFYLTGWEMPIRRDCDCFVIALSAFSTNGVLCWYCIG